jgi:hypothetical protein
MAVLRFAGSPWRLGAKAVTWALKFWILSAGREQKFLGRCDLWFSVALKFSYSGAGSLALSMASRNLQLGGYEYKSGKYRGQIQVTQLFLP